MAGFDNDALQLPHHDAPRTASTTEERRTFGFRWQPAGDLISCSPGAAPLLGMRGPMVGAHFLARLHGEEDTLFRARVAALSPQQPTYALRFTFRHPDGYALPFDEHGSASFDTQGRLVCVSAVVAEAEDAAALTPALPGASHRDHAWLQLALTSTGTAVWEWDLRDDLLRTSANIGALFGRATLTSADELFGLVHPDDRARHRAALAGDLADSGRYRSEHRILRADDGSVRWIEEYGEARRDAFGKVVGVTAIARDVSDRHHHEEAYRLLHLRSEEVLRNMADAYYAFDRHWRYLEVNDAGARATGLTREQLIGYNVWDLFPDAAGTELQKKWQRAMTERVPLHFEFHYAAFDQWWENRVVPIPEGIAVFATDIGRRKRAEADLQRKGRELQRLNRELEEITYLSAHDLRAPLRAVANLAQWIDEDLPADGDPDLRERLALLRRRVMGMDHLLSGVLAYASATAGEEEPALVDLRRVLEALTRELALGPAFRLCVDSPLPALHARPADLSLVFRQLLANARDHHDRPAGRIRVRAGEADEAWCIELADDGPGIPASYRERMLRPFTSLSKDAGERGHGLGLALVNKVVRRYGGTLELADAAPRGLLCRIHWPK